MTIEWRPIPGFPDYEVSDTGLVRSHKRKSPHILGTSKQPNSYRQVALRRNGQTHVRKVGRLVLLAFRGPCPEGCEMCHNDGNPVNDHLDNLRWDTHAGNMQDVSWQHQDTSHHFRSTNEGIKCIRCNKLFHQLFGQPHCSGSPDWNQAWHGNSSPRPSAGAPAEKGNPTHTWRFGSE